MTIATLGTVKRSEPAYRDEELREMRQTLDRSIAVNDSAQEALFQSAHQERRFRTAITHSSATHLEQVQADQRAAGQIRDARHEYENRPRWPDVMGPCRGALHMVGCCIKVVRMVPKCAAVICCVGAPIALFLISNALSKTPES